MGMTTRHLRMDPTPQFSSPQTQTQSSANKLDPPPHLQPHKPGVAWSLSPVPVAPTHSRPDPAALCGAKQTSDLVSAALIQGLRPARRPPTSPESSALKVRSRPRDQAPNTCPRPLPSQLTLAPCPANAHDHHAQTSAWLGLKATWHWGHLCTEEEPHVPLPDPTVQGSCLLNDLASFII